MTWIDLLLVLLFAALIALGAERRLTGLFLGLAAVVLLRPLMILGDLSPLLAVAAALMAGLALALLARRAGRQRRSSRNGSLVLGGLGGALLGASLVLSLVVSLPIERNLSGQIVYPPQSIPGPLASAVSRSRLFREGRDILLYPLLDRQGDIAPGRRPVVGTLHRFLVVGEPWEGR